MAPGDKTNREARSAKTCYIIFSDTITEKAGARYIVNKIPSYFSVLHLSVGIFLLKIRLIERCQQKDVGQKDVGQKDVKNFVYGVLNTVGIINSI